MNSFDDIVNLGSIRKCSFNSVVGSVVRLSGHSDSEQEPGDIPNLFGSFEFFHNSIKASSTFAFSSFLDGFIDGSVRSTLIKVILIINFKRKWPITVRTPAKISPKLGLFGQYSTISVI